LVHSSYADNLKFIKNKPHKDSPKTPLKLGNKLGTEEIKQMINNYITVGKIYSQIWVPLKNRLPLTM